MDALFLTEADVLGSSCCAAGANAHICWYNSMFAILCMCLSVLPFIGGGLGLGCKCFVPACSLLNLGRHHRL